MEGVQPAGLTGEEGTVSTHVLINPGGPPGVFLRPPAGHQGVKPQLTLQGFSQDSKALNHQGPGLLAQHLTAISLHSRQHCYPRLASSILQIHIYQAKRRLMGKAVERKAAHLPRLT